MIKKNLPGRKSPNQFPPEDERHDQLVQTGKAAVHKKGLALNEALLQALIFLPAAPGMGGGKTLDITAKGGIMNPDCARNIQLFYFPGKKGQIIKTHL